MITKCLKVLSVIMALASLSISCAYADQRHFYVAGAGDVPIAVTVAGNPDGPEILLIHGLGHGRESFQFQLESDLAERFHIAAFDLRGHGQSGKPWTKDGYAEPAIWAQDVLSVIDAAGMKKPVVVGWSYGGLVAADFIRAAGRDALSGLVLVSSLAGMVNYTPDFSKGGEEMAEAYALLAQPSLNTQARAIEIIAPFLVFKQPIDGWSSEVDQLGLMLPPYVRPLLAAHKTDNDDLVHQLDFPVLVMHGAQDAAIPQSAVDALVSAAGTAKAYRFENAGHSPFAENPAAFNKTLSDFVNSVWKGRK